MSVRIVGLAMLFASRVALAHHSFAMFDMQHDLDLRGVAKSFTWQSPHSWLQVMVKNANGTPVEWSIEMGAPIMLYKTGMRAASVKAGDVVSMVVHPLRDGRPGGSLVSVVLADGRKLDVGATVSPLVDPAGAK